MIFDSRTHHQTKDKLINSKKEKEPRTHAHEYTFAPMKRPKRRATPTSPPLPTSTSSEPSESTFSTGSASTKRIGTCNIKHHYHLKTEIIEISSTMNGMNNKLYQLSSRVTHLEGRNKDLTFDNRSLRKENAKLHRKNIFAPIRQHSRLLE
jgi:hypothetical protein